MLSFPLAPHCSALVFEIFLKFKVACKSNFVGHHVNKSIFQGVFRKEDANGVTHVENV